MRCARLHFVSIERTPFDRAALASALAPFEELRPLAQALVAVWPPPLAGLHRLDFEGGRVTLTLALGDAATLLPQLVLAADALFLDGFAPARNPELWSPAVVRELARLAAPDATLASWTVAGGVRSALGDAGFQVEKRAGFANKREMLAGRRTDPPRNSQRERHAVIVGAGLAGTLVADRLALRGWEIEMLDREAERSAAAVGLLRPVVNLRDAINAQASRGAFLHALQHYRALQHDGYHLQWQRTGVLQLAGDEDEASRFMAIVQAQGWPSSLLQYVDADGARAIAGRPVRGPGWWFPEGAWVSPASLGVASLARAGTHLRRHTGRAVDRIAFEGDRWRALDGEGRVLADAPVMILANAADAARLAPQARLPLSRVRGQVTYLPADPARRMDVIVSGTGYAAPLEGGGLVVGATYQHDDDDRSVRAADHRDNLAKAESMLPGLTAGLHPRTLEGWTGFRATVPDRLPIFGEGATPGLVFATGLGSRGLLWAPIGAELLASALEGDPLPLTRDHAGAISPRRFLS
jgi:tRNA 5-methylaminomethyl-2-thiouridine biosynthesis bifunctional protein